MTLTWCGHSCFVFDTDEGTVVFDPYEPDYVPGLHFPNIAGDVILCSHGHNDHNYMEGVKQSRRMPGFKVETLNTFHDAQHGAARGENTVHIIDVNGFRLAHLGDLGHLLTDDQIRQMQPIDVLLIPVGGYYTIDARQAKQICDALQPKVIIPMHYRKGDMGFAEIAEPDEFLHLFSQVTEIQGHTVTLDNTVQGVVVFSAPYQDEHEE